MNTPIKNKKILWALGVVLGAAIVLTGAISFFSIRIRNVPAVHSMESETPAAAAQAATSTRAVGEGQREYQNLQYHFSILYPQELAVAEEQEGGGAVTVTFQNEEEVKGFQIFIVPYTGAQVSSAQFKKDIPSGVQEQLANIQVDGATGAAFYSTDAVLGATREVWFIRGGYLYEVTTLKSLDTWLDPIISSWEFI